MSFPSFRTVVIAKLSENLSLNIISLLVRVRNQALPDEHRPGLDRIRVRTPKRADRVASPTLHLEHVFLVRKVPLAEQLVAKFAPIFMKIHGSMKLSEKWASGIRELEDGREASPPPRGQAQADGLSRGKSGFPGRK